MDQENQIVELKSQIYALEQLLSVYEQTTVQQSERLAETIKKLESHMKDLITKDKEIEGFNLRLEETNRKLKELDKEKDEFISVASHELKTPLTSIRGFAQLLKSGGPADDAEKRKHYLELIEKNTVRLYDLIVDLVDSSRLNLGKLDLDIKANDVGPIFEEIKENMEIIIREKGITPDFSIESNMPRIMADSARLLQVLKNLLINAVHFTEKGTISLKIYHSGTFVQCEIKDTGEGIPLDKQANIFEKFYQADSSLTRKVKGSGLGLSLSKGLVEAMGGKIWFESKEGEGTTFSFTVPVAV